MAAAKLSLLTNFNRSHSPRTRWLWLLACLLAGVLLELAIPLSLPGGAVKQVQQIFLNLNFQDLLGKGRLPFLVVLLVGGLMGLGLFGLTAVLSAWQPVQRQHSPPRRSEWLAYALPMLLVWGIYLLAFWPAMMSDDSLHVWRQVQTGQFDNAHPLFYLLLVWLLTRVWNSPSVVPLAQMLALALLSAWGLGRLRARGLPGWAAWLVAGLMALAPANGALGATLWKDVPYSISLLALTLLVLFITLDPQDWLKRKSTWLLLGLVAVPAGLLRYNGLVIAPLVLLALGLVYRRHWTVFARALLVFLLVYFLVSKPLNALLHVQKTSIVSASLAVHHIAAHIFYGTQIEGTDRALLESILPLDQWHYYCYLVNPAMFNPLMNKQAALESTPQLDLLTVRLFLRNPTVDINQTFCAGSLVYRVLQPADGYFYAAALTPSGQNSAIYINKNNLGIRETPLLPEVNAGLIHLLENTRNGALSWLIWRPAFYLYLLLFTGSVYALRARSWRAALFLLPAVIHSTVLFAVNISQSFRYQYPVYLICLFALALLFLPASAADAHPQQ